MKFFKNTRISKGTLMNWVRGLSDQWKIAHLSLPWSIGWVAFLVCRLFVCRPAMVTSDQISILFKIFSGKKAVYQYRPILTQYHQVLTSTAFFWPSTIMIQPFPLNDDPVPPSTNQCRLPGSIGWVALSFLVYLLFVFLARYGNTRPNLHIFQYIQA